MPDTDLSAIARWPNVPACYGWLSLDRRGRWRLQGEPVTHPGLVAFINRQYGCDGAGRWFLQNGPQRVFVRLEYAPWVYRLAGGRRLMAHTGEEAGEARALWLDEEGSVLLAAAPGIGLLDDRDLVDFLAECRDSRGAVAGEEALLAALEGWGKFIWHGLAAGRLQRTEVAARFGFEPDPAPTPS